MNKLTILDWEKPKREVDFISYSATGCYIYNKDHERCVIDLWPPSGFSLKLTTPPNEIRRTILHLPSFNLAPQELVEVYSLLKGQDKSAPAKEPLLLATVHPRKKWDAPDLEKKLRKALTEKLRRLRHEYEAAKQEIAKRPEKDEREKARRELEYRFSFKRQDLSTVSVFAATLADVKDGLFELREKVLQEEFVKHYRLDAQQIGVECARFCQTIRLDTTDLPESTRERLAKRVRYKIHLTDNTDFWLEGIHERPLTTRQEIEEFEKLEEAAELAWNKLLPLDSVLWGLASERKGKRVPMGLKGFEKLCVREKIDFENVKKRGMRRSQINRLLKKRELQKRVRVAQLRKLHAGETNQACTETSTPSPIENDDPQQQPSSGGGSLSILDENLSKIKPGKKKS